MAYKLSLTVPAVQLNRHAALEELKADTLTPSEDLHFRKSVNLQGLGVKLDPAKPARVDVRETTLSDCLYG